MILTHAVSPTRKLAGHGSARLPFRRRELRRRVMQATTVVNLKGHRDDPAYADVIYAPTDVGRGSEAAGDILIGADGIHSRTRQLLNPDLPSPRFTGLISVGGYSRSTNLAATTGTQRFVFGKRAFFGYLVRESGEVYRFTNPHRPNEPTPRQLAPRPSDEGTAVDVGRTTATAQGRAVGAADGTPHTIAGGAIVYERT
ncbi:hypothetical protein [Micromonospora sp. DT47]|uniref:hypothetical protein n=1 Tax=Micromonospora sp. DT47 TaxID=3393431 RepID=UPI003CEBAF1A